jgi:hypothetical protein
MKRENDCVQKSATEGKGNGVSLFEVLLQISKARTAENHRELSTRIVQLLYGPKLKKSIPRRENRLMFSTRIYTFMTLRLP